MANSESELEASSPRQEGRPPWVGLNQAEPSAEAFAFFRFKRLIWESFGADGLPLEGEAVIRGRFAAKLEQWKVEGARSSARLSALLGGVVTSVAGRCALAGELLQVLVQGGARWEEASAAWFLGPSKALAAAPLLVEAVEDLDMLELAGTHGLDLGQRNARGESAVDRMLLGLKKPTTAWLRRLEFLLERGVPCDEARVGAELRRRGLGAAASRLEERGLLRAGK